MCVEPRDGALDLIALVSRAGEEMALVFIDDELGFDAQRSQRMPEFIRLRRRAFAVAVADQH